MSENENVEFEENEDEFEIDLNEAEEDVTSEVLPRGTYECEVSDLTFDYSQSSGNPMWTWVLEVIEGDYTSKKLWYHTVFAGKALGRTKKTIAKVMPQLLEGKFSPQGIADAGEMIGLKVKAVVTIGRYEGKPTNSVKDLMPGGSGDFL